METIIRIYRLNSNIECNAELPLLNSELFIRDNYTCLYCGSRRPPGSLMRDYIHPLSQSGEECWSNTATACLECGEKKLGYSLMESGMTLRAVPYAPCLAETRILARRNFMVHNNHNQQRGLNYAEA